MEDITKTFGTLYKPVKTLVVYQEQDSNDEIYVESYDMDRNGFPINAHPLTVKESAELALALDTSEELKRNFLKPAGLLPKNVLYINPDQNGYAIWHTPRQRVELYFIDDLKIPCGKACVPALLWKASKSTLWIYGLAENETVTEKTPLFCAPFFNIYHDGKVCMGTVNIQIEPDCLLEDFIERWQSYFFNSYFSHLLGSTSPVKGNIIQLWQNLVGTRKAFPVKSLLSTGYNLKHIIS